HTKISDLVGISTELRLECEFHKQSSLALPDAIENFGEIASVLRGTQFEYCLEDEPMYRAPSVELALTEPSSSTEEDNSGSSRRQRFLARPALRRGRRIVAARTSGAVVPLPPPALRLPLEFRQTLPLDPPTLPFDA